MIDFITDMQSLEIRDEIYERFLSFKVKYNPNVTNEEFIQFLMTQYENCCSRTVCNGYINGVTEHNRLDSEIAKSSCDNINVNLNIDSEAEIEESERIVTDNYQTITCPECKYTSDNHHTIKQHFNDYHDMNGTFPCTCGQCFYNLSQFLAHYITCPIAATDLQNTSLLDEEFEEEEISVNDDEKELSSHVYEIQSPIVQSIDPSPIHTDDSNDQPLDFHIHSPSYSNPLNLVKNESAILNNIDYPPMNIDSNNSSGNEKPRLPDHNPSSIATSSPGTTDQSRKPCKVYQCEHCEKNFKSKGLLDQHKHLHFPPRHECEHCGRRFRWPPQFYTHKQQCSKRKFSNNDSRDAVAFKKNSYNFSPVSINNNNNNNNNNDHNEVKLQSAGKLFPHSPITEQCPCCYQAIIATDMYEHKRSCVASARALILQKIIDFKSIQTPTLPSNLSNVNGNGTIMSQPSLHRVMNNFMPNTIDCHTVTGTTPCQITKLNELKPFECDFCESRFMTKISLKQHLDGKHSDQAKYCCEKCGKGYFWNASYNYHKKKCTFQPLPNLTAPGLK